jgi:hypothetical protein
MVVEVVTGVLIGLLALVTVFAAYLGILGLTQAASMTRCRICGRLELRSGSGDGCVHAGHPRHSGLSAAGGLLHAHFHLPRAVLHRHQ